MYGNKTDFFVHTQTLLAEKKNDTLRTKFVFNNVGVEF